MSKPRGFDFDPAEWISNRALRSCSPAARAFYIDLLCLCWPLGRLVVPGTGVPVDDVKLARMVGEKPSVVRAWLLELGGAGMYGVDEHDTLFIERLVKRAAFVEASREHGKRGGAMRRERKLAVVPECRPVPGTQAASVERSAENTPVVVPTSAPAHQPPVPPRRPTLPWWKSPAGWVRTANQQALSLNPGEALADFKLRVSLRIPPGPHLEELSKSQMKQWEAAQPKPAEGGKK